MPYETTPDPYIDPVTGVLRNILDITTTEALEDAEASITATAIASLSKEPLSGAFDLVHVRVLHRELFHTIYSWAGELRTVEVAKGDTRFANAAVIEMAADGIFAALHTEHLLKDLSSTAYAARLAHYYSEINILHPFREGNGRTQRLFFDLLVRESGYRLAWERIDASENIAACVAAYQGNEERLMRMLAGLVEML
jgi:cell filamentation protein